MSRFAALRHHLLASTAGGGGGGGSSVAFSTTALNMGVNFTLTGWKDHIFHNRFSWAGAWMSVPSSGTNAVLDPTVLDSNKFPTKVPTGYAYVMAPVVHTKSTNPTGSYVFKWTGNMAAANGGGPVSNAYCTISSVDSVNKTCIMTPVNPSSPVPMMVQYAIDPADTAAGTYPGGPNAADPNNLIATYGNAFDVRPQGETPSILDPDVVTALVAIKPKIIRLCRSCGVEDNGGPSNPPSSHGWGAAWGADSGTQSAPVYKITMASRATSRSAVKSSRDSTGGTANLSVAWGGIPVEDAVLLANTLYTEYGLAVFIWWYENWNSDPAVSQYNATYLRDNLLPNLGFHLAVSNEVWNAAYSVNGQASMEAGYLTDGNTVDPTMVAKRTSGTALPKVTSSQISYNATAARYVEKCVEVFGYYDTIFAQPSSQAGGAKPTMVKVAEWWHSQGGSMCGLILDYVAPNAGGQPFSAFADAYATSFYPAQDNIDRTTHNSVPYDPSRGIEPLLADIFYDVENLIALETSIKAACDARGIKKFTYETSDSVALDTNNSTDNAVATSLHRDPRMKDFVNFSLSRLENANPGGRGAWYAMRGDINSWNGTFGLLEDLLQDPNGTTPAPQYLGFEDFEANDIRRPIDLDGSLLVAAGAAVGDVVGYVRRRLPGTNVTAASPFAVNDTGQSIVPVTVADASAFTTGGTTNAAHFHETGGNPSTTHDTTLTCYTLATPFFSPKLSSSSNAWEDYNAVKDTTGCTVRNVTSNASDVVAVINSYKTNGYWEFTANPSVDQQAQMCLIGSNVSSSSNPYWNNAAACWAGDTHGVVVRNGAVLSVWNTWAANAKLAMYLSSTSKLYGAICGVAGAAISSITFSGTTATVTTATAHSIPTGSYTIATISGAAPSAYNVTNVEITVTGPTTFTYTMATTPATNATTVGTYTYSQWRGVPHTLPFTSSSTASINAGDTIRGVTSGNSAQVGYVQITSGSWAAGTAAGNLWLLPATGTFTTGETLTSSGRGISSITFSGTTATVTTSSAHGLSTGQTITLTGAVPSDYNVTNVSVTSTGTNTFTYTMLTTPATKATSVGSYVCTDAAISGTDSPPTVDPNTDTGGIDVSAVLSSATGGKVAPAVHSERYGFGGAGRFTTATFLYPLPTGASDWT